MELLLIIVAGLVIWFVIIYNKLRAEAETVRGSRSNILAATRKRLDLAKRISDVAAGYAEHEKIIQVSAGEAMSNIAESQNADQKVNQVMGQISALAVAYPNLKADKTYSKLMDQWNALENDIQNTRETYNARVTNYNAYRGAIPQVLFATPVGFGPAPYYETDVEGLDTVPDFVTDDGEMLRETMGRLKDKTKIAASKAKVKLEEAKVNLEKQVQDHNKNNSSTKADKDSS